MGALSDVSMGDTAKSPHTRLPRNRGAARLLTTQRVVAMREWLLTILPLAVVIYFVLKPDQFVVAMYWIQQFLG